MDSSEDQWIHIWHQIRIVHLQADSRLPQDLCVCASCVAEFRSAVRWPHRPEPWCLTMVCSLPVQMLWFLQWNSSSLVKGTFCKGLRLSLLPWGEPLWIVMLYSRKYTSSEECLGLAAINHVHTRLGLLSKTTPKSKSGSILGNTKAQIYG